MRFKALALSGLILCLLIVYLLFFEIPSAKKKSVGEIRSKKVLLFEEKDLKGFEVRSDGYDISVDRTDNVSWKITAPIRTEPDPEMISRFISLIGNIAAKRVVEERSSDIKIFGLARPVVEILLRLKDREERLILGNRGPIKNTLYIQKGGDDKILLVDDRLIEEIPDRFYTWRRKQVLHFDQTHVDEFRLTYKDRSFFLIKENDKWSLKKPIETTADQGEVNDLLSSLSRLSVHEFVDEGKEDLIKKISPPILKAVLKIQGEEKGVSFYLPTGRKKGIMYAVTANEDPIYMIDELLFKGLDKDLYRLREKQALDIKEESVAGIEIRKNNEIFRIVKEKDNWIINGKPEQKIDSPRIKDLLNLLKDIRAERFVDDAPIDLLQYGLSKPQSMVSLFDKDNKPVGTLLFGREKGDMIYAKNDRSRSIFLVKKEVFGSIPETKDLTGNQK
ncbi:MAG: DUF4340 domain-containing protein [Nitrospirae bacterium]|nr:DUF4340 domain-containing protein [Nitrospirota bacterium]